MNRSERRRENRRIENNYFQMKSDPAYLKRMDPEAAKVMKEVLNPSAADQLLAVDLNSQPCYYCGDTEAPAMIVKERNNQVICIHCVNKGVGKYDNSWQRK